MTGSTVTKYYFAGASRIAMRKYTIPQSMSVEYLLGDHLGSTSITTDVDGAKVSEMRYKPWGEVRYSWTDPGLNTTPAYEPMKYTFTGQYSYTSDFGLMFYNARWYDPAIGRFAQADTIVPNNVQGFDRYAYVLNNPLRYTDPSGHCPEDDEACIETIYQTLPLGDGLTGGQKLTLRNVSIAMWRLGINLNTPEGVQKAMEFVVGTEFGEGMYYQGSPLFIAMTRRYWEYCSPEAGGPNGYACIISFWGYMQGVLEAGTDPSTISGNMAKITENSKDVASAILNPGQTFGSFTAEEKWQGGCGRQEDGSLGLCDWANAPGPELVNALRDLGLNCNETNTECTIFDSSHSVYLLDFGDGDYFVVFSHEDWEVFCVQLDLCW